MLYTACMLAGIGAGKALAWLRRPAHPMAGPSPLDRRIVHAVMRCDWRYVDDLLDRRVQRERSRYYPPL